MSTSRVCWPANWNARSAAVWSSVTPRKDFAAAIGLPQRAAAAANALALAAASAIHLEELPFTGSPLNGALRELRFRRAELTA